MTVKIGHASSDENGKYSGGKAGDQTGREVAIRTWYNRPWNKVVRPKSKTVALAIARTCIAACNNNNIGYDQYQRTTLYTQALKVDFDLAKINTPCECDCSSLVAVCVNAAGIKVSKDIYTGNMVAALKNTGAFDVLTDNKYLSSSSLLNIGDILVYEGHHTAIVVDTDDGSDISDNSECKEIKIASNKTGLKITASSLNIRKFPSTTGTATGKSYKKGEYIFPTAKAFVGDSHNEVWLKTNLGWCSAKYVEGWIQESDGRWWFVTEGYKSTTGLFVIDEYTYFFDNAGWLITDSWVQVGEKWMFTNHDGVIICDGWLLRDGHYYYLDKEGYMVTDAFIIDDGNLYYLQENGIMYRGSMSIKTDNNGALHII